MFHYYYYYYYYYYVTRKPKDAGRLQLYINRLHYLS